MSKLSFAQNCLGHCVFVHLFEWSTHWWEPAYTYLYFCETPSVVSSRNMAQWFQQVANGEFRHYDHGSVTANRSHYGRATPPSYKLRHVTCPVALVSGGHDSLVDVAKLKAALPNVVYNRVVDLWYHLDPLNAKNAPDVLFPDLLDLIERIQRSSQREAERRSENVGHPLTHVSHTQSTRKMEEHKEALSDAECLRQ